nr:hypothetical protein [Tanacetum cinerariifolium]
MLTLSWSSISSANSSVGATRMLMEHKDAQGQIVFTSRAWRRLFDIRGPLVHELILEFFSTFRLIACSIAERSQAPKKVMVTDLFYLRGMDINSVNIPYLLARYLRLFASGRKSGALILGGQFVARLDEHFGLLTEERLLGLTIISPTLPVINMDELVRLQILARSMPQRMDRIEEDVCKIRGALGEQREARVTYTSYVDFQIPYQRRVRRRTSEANTSAAQQDEQQPEP